MARANNAGILTCSTKLNLISMKCRTSNMNSSFRFGLTSAGSKLNSMMLLNILVPSRYLKSTCSIYLTFRRLHMARCRSRRQHSPRKFLNAYTKPRRRLKTYNSNLINFETHTWGHRQKRKSANRRLLRWQIRRHCKYRSWIKKRSRLKKTSKKKLSWKQSGTRSNRI